MRDRNARRRLKAVVRGSAPGVIVSRVGGTSGRARLRRAVAGSAASSIGFGQRQVVVQQHGLGPCELVDLGQRARRHARLIRTAASRIGPGRSRTTEHGPNRPGCAIGKLMLPHPPPCPLRRLSDGRLSSRADTLASRRPHTRRRPRAYRASAFAAQGAVSEFRTSFTSGVTPPPAATIWRIPERRGFVTAQPHKRPRSSWRQFAAELPSECWQATSRTRRWPTAAM